MLRFRTEILGESSQRIGTNGPIVPNSASVKGNPHRVDGFVCELVSFLDACDWCRFNSRSCNLNLPCRYTILTVKRQAASSIPSLTLASQCSSEESLSLLST